MVKTTQCPYCFTVYEISEEQFRISQGKVRCGTCRERFIAKFREDIPPTEIDISQLSIAPIDESAPDGDIRSLNEIIEQQSAIQGSDFSFEDNIHSELSITIIDDEPAKPEPDLANMANPEEPDRSNFILEEEPWRPDLQVHQEAEQSIDAPAPRETPYEIAPDDIASEEVFPEAVAPEEIIPEAIIPEAIVPEEIIPEEMIPEEMIPEAIVPEEVIPEEMIPEAIVPEEVIPEEMIPEAIVPEEMIPEEMIPEAIVPEEMIPEEMIPDAIVPEEVIPEEIIPEAIVPEEVIPEEIIPEEIIPEEMIPEAIVPEEIIPEEIVPEGVIPEGVIPEGVIPEGVIPEGVIPEGVIPEGIVPEELVPEEAAPQDATSALNQPNDEQAERINQTRLPLEDTSSQPAESVEQTIPPEILTALNAADKPQDEALIDQVDQLIEDKILTFDPGLPGEKASNLDLDFDDSVDAGDSQQDDVQTESAFHIDRSKSSGRTAQWLGIPFMSLIVLCLSALMLYQFWLRQSFGWLESNNLPPAVESTLSSFAGPLEAELQDKLNISLPVRRDLKNMHLIAAQTEPHPTRSSTILLRVQLANRSDIAQPFPWLELSLSDEGGRLVARRALPPSDYLHNNNTPNRIFPNELKRVAIELLTFPEQATGYELKLLDK